MGNPPDNEMTTSQESPQSTLVTSKKRSRPIIEAEQLVRDRVAEFFESKQFHAMVAKETERGIDVECLQ